MSRQVGKNAGKFGRITASTVALLIVVSACSSSDSSGDSPSEQDTDQPTEPVSGDSDGTEQGDAIVAEDQQLAEQAVLSLDDLEPGWRETDPSEDNEEKFESIPSCDTFTETRERDRKTRTGLAETAFAGSGDDAVRSAVAAFPSVTDAEAAMDALRNESYGTCIEDVLTEAIAEEVDSARFEDFEASFGRASAEQLGDDTLAYQIEAVATLSGGFQASGFVDNITVRVGRFLARTTTESSFGSLLELEDYAQVVVNRLAAATGG